VALLALLVLSAAFFCAIVGYVLARQADDRQGLERRAALIVAIDDTRNSGADFSALDPGHIRGMERNAGLKDLRFEAEPLVGNREVQSVLDRHGRIVGWFTWQPDRSMSNSFTRLQPLLVLAGIFLIGFAGNALLQARRAERELSNSERLALKLAHKSESDNRRFLEHELRRALDEQTINVHYQPIVSANGSRIVGAEALLRWTHPQRGAIPPAKFVAVAEHSGLMGRLGEFVLRRALSDAKRWPDLFISVNLSPVQVRDPALVDLVAGLLAEYRMPASRLMLEVTEGMLIDNPDEAKAQLDALAALGVRLALDDFGTGYSSLTYLQRFSFDKLKIDRGFVEPLGRDAKSHAMLQAIVALGRGLGLTMLAEGVETEQQRVLLRLAGCEEMQGYLFARPGPREALDKLLVDARLFARATRPVVRSAAA